MPVNSLNLANSSNLLQIKSSRRLRSNRLKKVKKFTVFKESGCLFERIFRIAEVQGPSKIS